MAGALVSVLLDQITAVLSPQVQEELSLVGGVKKQVDKLKSNLINIQSVLEDAERKQVKDKAVRVWLDKLKDVCYDMDDMLDEWSTAIPTWEMDEENTRPQKKMRFFLMAFPISYLKKGFQSRDIALKIKEINEKLDEIAKEKAMYGFELNKVVDHQLPRLTSTSLVDEWSVCGRDGEKKSVVNKLLAEMDDNNLGEAIVKTSIERVRHLSMMLSRQTSFPSSIYRAKGLHSLLINNSGHPWLGAALPDVMKQLTCIRFLNLSGSSIEKISKEIGKLIHLRHLNLEGCRELVSLPETMCDLCNLQSLDVSKCSSLYELPRAIVKLIKLRHLRIYASGVAFMPNGIERLTCLRTLDCFIVCGGGENESKAANLRELKNLNHIGGRLEIRNLQGGGIEDAVEAQLKNKKRLLCLELNFYINYEDYSLIEVLEPSLDLEKLRIYNYGGIVLPKWMMALTRLQELTLAGCGNLEVLPPLRRLPNLENLILFKLQVRRLDAGFVGIEEVENANINEGEIARVTVFPKLKTLVIGNLFELEEWDGIERRVGEEDATTTSIFIMPQLQHLTIMHCPLLRALPDYVLAASLQVLELRDCGNVEVLPPLGRLPNLEILSLIRMGVRRLDAGFLGIEEVENANNINEGEIARVTAFPKLKFLAIQELFELEEWDGIERRVGEEDATTTSIFIMPQLQHLIIDDCPLLRALPDYVLVAPLQRLLSSGCPNLGERYGKYGKEEKGEDWHKISHIREVFIY
ncbi:hypothetical protein OIU79_029295 [Salix purpurea]|uniref:Rx N-terminal domain-containing protein n=1 Tax=Salix purpurea TaxID=77065 RepID=A0A9Q0ZV75_SALPP|nr:hypothetical protein OIU79_029295 [Salix purpurea]